MMDEGQFEQRVRACTQKLFRVCYTILPDASDRDDAIQEALIKAWQRRHTLRKESAFEGWLMRIVINECKNILRQRRRTVLVELDENLAISDPDLPDLTLRAALLRLKLELRLPLVLHYVEGYTIQETAQLLHLPTGTLKHRLNRGKSQLKLEMSKGEELV